MSVVRLATRTMVHNHRARVLVPIAAGSEDLEVVTIIDILRRAGAAVDVAAVGGEGPMCRQVTLARGSVLVADMAIADAVPPYHLIALPGGMPGATHLRDNAMLTTLLQHQFDERRPLAAICAAPAVVLAAHGLISATTTATAHSAFVASLPGREGNLRVARDVSDGRVTITSRGPGSAIEFALECVRQLLGSDKMAEVARPLHLHAAQLTELGLRADQLQ